MFCGNRNSKQLADEGRPADLPFHLNTLGAATEIYGLAEMFSAKRHCFESFFFRDFGWAVRRLRDFLKRCAQCRSRILGHRPKRFDKVHCLPTREARQCSVQIPCQGCGPTAHILHVREKPPEKQKSAQEHASRTLIRSRAGLPCSCPNLRVML